MKRTYEDRIRESQERIAREKAKQRTWIAAENARRRKERNHRIYTIGGVVESILKDRYPTDPLDQYAKTVSRLIRIGMAADEVLGHPVDAQIIKFFLDNQEERGHYFSKFMEQREGEGHSST